MDDATGETIVKQLAALDSKLAAVKLYVGVATVGVLIVAAAALLVITGLVTLKFDLP